MTDYFDIKVCKKCGCRPEIICYQTTEFGTEPVLRHPENEVCSFSDCYIDDVERWNTEN